MLAFDGIRSGGFESAVAGGMESMTNAPYLVPKARGGYRYGHGQLLDHMALDGLEDAYHSGRSMGTFAEDTTAEYGFSRGEQDAYALASLSRARDAAREARFAGEIVRLDENDADEQPTRICPEKIPLLKPAFRAGGIVTAAHSSPISDGAAALVVASDAFAYRKGLTPRATIVAHATAARAPEAFTTAPVGAISILLDKVGWALDDVDLFEINEAFAVVPMVAMRDLGIPHDRLNVNGGACALGHPIGASGARIVVTLLNALEQRGSRRGIAAICLGGGEATAVAIERGEA
jgi:acetyl-CoA C-acetyltransferase